MGRGLASAAIVGLPDASVNSSKERVRSAIRNSGLIFPYQRLTVNMAPADLRKEGPAYGLPMALGILLASEQILADTDRAIVIGELSLVSSARAFLLVP